MKKVIALLDQDKEVEKLCKEIHQNSVMLKEELKFIERQLNNKQEKINESNEQHWEKIKEILKNKNILLQDFSEETHTLSFSIEENSISIEDDRDIEDEIISVPMPKSVFIKFMDLIKK